MSRRHSYHFTGAMQSPGDRPSSDGSTRGHSQDQPKHKAEDIKPPTSKLRQREVEATETYNPIRAGKSNKSHNKNRLPTRETSALPGKGLAKLTKGGKANYTRSPSCAPRHLARVHKKTRGPSRLDHYRQSRPTVYGQKEILSPPPPPQCLQAIEKLAIQLLN